MGRASHEEDRASRAKNGTLDCRLGTEAATRDPVVVIGARPKLRLRQKVDAANLLVYSKRNGNVQQMARFGTSHRNPRRALLSSAQTRRATYFRDVERERYCGMDE